MSTPVVLVTGGTRGIGAAVCHALAPDHDLIIGGRSADEVNAACRRYRAAEPFVADLTDEEATARAVAGLGLASLAGLVHSAGVAGGAPTGSSTRQMWRSMFELNVFAVSDLTRLLLPALAADRGTIVTINSGAGLRASGVGGHYPASKFALRALTDVLRSELRPEGIRVCGVHPGRVDTDMQRLLVASENRPYDPEEFLRPGSVAAAVRFALTMTEDAGIDEISIRPGPATERR